MYAITINGKITYLVKTDLGRSHAIERISDKFVKDFNYDEEVSSVEVIEIDRDNVVEI